MGACVSREVGAPSCRKSVGEELDALRLLQVAPDGVSSGEDMAKPPTAMRASWLPELFETEGARIKSLTACGLIDTPYEKRFDRITTSVAAPPAAAPRRRHTLSASLSLAPPALLWRPLAAG